MRTLISSWAIVLAALSASWGKPNILFIAVDDLRPELGAYGSRAVTPNLDALAKESLVFERAYCNQAVCGASRLSLMSGHYPEFTDERTFHVTGWRERWPDVLTLNQHFTANGYTSIGLGKVYHGTGGEGVDPENWSRWIRVRNTRSYLDPENARIHREASREARPGQIGGRPRGPSTESADVGDNRYADGARAERAVRQIEEFASAGQPFFLAVGFTKPHLPFVAPKKYWDLYERSSFSLPQNLSVPPGYPEWARNLRAGELRSYSDCPKGPTSKFPDAFNKRLLHGYFACVSYLDAQVGKVLTALEKTGLAENTIVVFWGDHGWKLGDHASWCKHTNFECDTRVPLIIRHPGKPAATGKRTRSLVELIDLYPTLCELSGVAVPAHIQGRSFSALFTDPTAVHRDSAYSSYPHRAGRDVGPVIGHSLRTERYRYTEWWKRNSDLVVDRVLTDIESDPGEQTNLLPGSKELADRLAGSLRARVLAARLGSENENWQWLFDGNELSKWKANTDPDAFTVVDGAIRANATHPKNRAHLFFTGENITTLEHFANFELSARVRGEPGANSGIFFHTDMETRDGVLHLKNGYEIQLVNSPRAKALSGSLYDVVSVDPDVFPKIDQAEWFPVRIRVEGKRIRCWIDHVQVIDYTEPDKVERSPRRKGRVLRKEGGAIALQAHDEKSRFYFKDVKIRRL